ncbi:hypothetical protein ACSV4D_09525 [Flavobacterium sp. ARAG 55.4]|uniref:hypothetical protein n=1 Tax=Flavobacterium sp. ARAG 55.4 TaxID=3451357 RepID=UPI003F44FB06
MQKQVLHNQSLLDVAIQYNGFVTNVFELALKNGLSVTETLIPGQSIEFPLSDLIDTELVDYFKGKNQMIATGFNGSDNEDIIPQLGIGSMQIGSTFIVG